MSKVLLSSGLVGRARVGGLARLLVGLALLGSALMVFAAPSAFAAYEITGTFAGDGPGQGGSGSADGQLSDPGQADVLSSTGALYVADTANNRVQRFTPTTQVAEYSAQVAVSSPTGLAIDQSDGSIYVATATGIAKLTSDLTPAAGWTDPAITGTLTLAVDPSTGDLLVADRDANTIRRFASDGTAGTTFAAARPLDLAVSSTGEVFVVTSTGDIYGDCGAISAVERFNSAGLAGMPFPSVSDPGTVAIDPDDDSVIVGMRVREYNCGFNGNAFGPYVRIFSAAGVTETTIVLGGRCTALCFADLPGLAVAGAGSSRIYAVMKGPFDDGWGPTRVVAIRDLSPPIPTISAPSAVMSTSAQINGAVNPGGKQTTAHIDYRRTGIGASWTSLPDHDVGAGAAPVTISDSLADLAPGRPYSVRIVATSDDGNVTSAVGEFATASEAPVVQTRSVSDLVTTSVRLRGTVDSRGGATTYYFEYGSSTAYGSQIPLAPQGVDPSGLSAVSQLVTGLRPGTAYHYRVVAVNPAGRANGDDVSFATPMVDPGTRTYEQVSEAQKYNLEVLIEPGGGDQPTNYLEYAAGDGARLGYVARGVFADAESGGTSVNNYMARRTPSGWVSQSYNFKGQAKSGGTIVGWSDDLTRGVYGALSASTTLVANQTPGATNFFQLDTVDKHLVAATPDPGLGESGGDYTLRYRGGSADLSTMVYEDTTRRTLSAPSPFVQSVYVWHDDRPGVVELVSMLPDPDGAGPLIEEPAPNGATVAVGPHVVSDDGTKIVFTTPDGRLYVRIGGEKTVEVSASQKATPDAAQAATFGAATSDGSKVFFTTSEQLIDADTDGNSDLYRYDVNTGELTRLAVGAGLVLGASDDGSYVYFERGGIELWHNGDVKEVLADIRSVDRSQGTLRVSADGTGIVFLNLGQVYQYSADADQLYCASCRDDGGPATNAELPRTAIGGLGAAGFLEKVGFQRSITSDGDRVFFTSADPLVGGDVNNKRDAYEFYDGQPHLVSSGRADSNSYFMDASADGRDVFFATRERLVAGDSDDVFDIYDARAGGGFPSDPVVEPCDGEGCQGAVSPVASPPVVGSVAFGAEGDAPPVRGKMSVTHSVSGSSARLRITVPGNGRIVVSGASVKRLSKSAAKAGTYTIRVVLTAKARQSLARHKRLKVMLNVAYTASSGGSATKSVALSFKQPTASKRIAATRRSASAKAGR